MMGSVQSRLAAGCALTACLAAGFGGARDTRLFARDPVGKGATAAETTPAARSQASLQLPAALEKIAQIVAPRADETRWRKIPWLTDLAQAQRVAKEENRPLFVFVSGDEPLEAC